ncbi:MAG: GAF domain-containing protein [Ideonella sp.]|nr:GAF domain-containing protein [Ideonella sp.]
MTRRRSKPGFHMVEMNHAHPRGRPKAEYSAHLQGRPRPEDSAARLVESGLRLNEPATSAALHDLILEQLAHLLGAQRALLVLESLQGATIAGSQLPRDEAGADLLAAITPWLDEARRTRSPSLHHGPEGAAAIDQRSCLVAPLLAQQQCLGFVYADLDGLFGRFHDTDRHLLATLAAQAAVALARLRTIEGLEQQVAERTLAAEQRAGELAVINAIQRAMAAELEFQAIVDLVGDKLREVFASRDLYIGLLDADGKTMHMAYTVEHGVRQTQASFVPRDDRVWYREVRAGRTVIGRNAADFAAYQMGVMPGTDMPSSGVYVPIMVSERYIGQVGIESFEREDAFDESAVRLLQTVVSSLGTALENARLFAETQRLLKETKARNAELAVINSIQQGLVAQLDIDAVVDLVGDKLREVFHSDDLVIVWVDEEAMVLTPAYFYERGVRLTRVAPHPLKPDGVNGRLLRERRAVAVNTRAEMSGRPVPGTALPMSFMRAPVVAAGRVIALVNVDNFEREHAFSEGDLRLLETVSTALGLALQSARLFDQTQAALQRQTASADILRAISQSPNDVMPVVDVIVSTARQLLGCHRTAFLRREGEVLVAMRSAKADGLSPGRFGTVPLDVTHNFPSRVLISRAPLHIPDWSALELSEHELAVQRQTGCRASLMLPLLRGTDQEALGVLIFQRDQPVPFSEADIALAQSFADQAVIAIENVRLFNETKEALERQTATAEVLQVISSSVADAAPVFDKILECCERLLPCASSNLFLINEADMLVLQSSRWTARGRAKAGVEAVAAVESAIRTFYPRPWRETATGLCVAKGDVVDMRDPLNDTGVPEGVRGVAHQLSSTLGFAYAQINVPLLWHGRGIGSIAVLRDVADAHSATQGFSLPEHALLKTFADQAVIAIQNARLFNETSEALAQQKATAEILRVISDRWTRANRSSTRSSAAASTCLAADGLDVRWWRAGLLRVPPVSLRRPARPSGDACPGAGDQLGARPRDHPPAQRHYADVINAPGTPPIRRRMGISPASLGGRSCRWSGRTAGSAWLTWRVRAGAFSEEEMRCCGPSPTRR